jgi:hypothetical protein
MSNNAWMWARRLFCMTALVTAALPIGANAGDFGYVDTVGDGYFVIKNGVLYTQVLGEKTHVRIGVPTRISDYIVRVGSTYYRRWEGYAEHQAKKFRSTGIIWHCTPDGLRAK